MHVYMRVWPGDVLLQPSYDPSKGLASLYYLVWWESEHETPRMSDGHYCSILGCGICWSESPISWFEVHAAPKRGQPIQVNYRIHLWSWWRVEATADVHGRSTLNWSVKSFMEKARAEKSSWHKLILEAVDCMLFRAHLKWRWKRLVGSCIMVVFFFLKKIFCGRWEGDNVHWELVKFEMCMVRIK